MTPRRAWLGTLPFLLLVPGTVAGVIPWWIGRWTFHDWPGQVIGVPLGALLVIGGFVLLLHTMIEFAARGRGTPAPIAPPQRLVVTGAYRYVRHPMYAAILGILFGQALAFADPRIALYSFVMLLIFTAFVYLHEEAELRQRFGDRYERYAANVPRWFPRLTPYYDA